MNNSVRNNEIIRLANKGMTYREIGNQFRISKARVHQIFKNYYGYIFSDSERKRIFDFWENQCGDCGKRESVNLRDKTKLEIHHINGDRRNNEMSNLIVLCRKCHYETEKRLFRNGLKTRKKRLIHKIKVSSRNYRTYIFYPKTCPICQKNFKAISQNNSRAGLKGFIDVPYPVKRKFCSQECYKKSDIFKNKRKVFKI